MRDRMGKGGGDEATASTGLNVLAPSLHILQDPQGTPRRSTRVFTVCWSFPASSQHIEDGPGAHPGRPTRAKKAAKSGPVFITDRGTPAHVLLSIEDYRRLTGQGRSLVEALSLPGLADIDFGPPRARIAVPPPDLA